MSSTKWSTTARYIVSVGLFLFGLYMLYLFGSIMALVVMAAIIAFLVRPLINLLHYRLKAPWGVSVLVSYLLATIIILLAPLIFVPPIVNAVNFLFYLDYQTVINQGWQWLQDSLLHLKMVNLRLMGINLRLDNLLNPVLAALQSAEPAFTPQLPSLDILVNSLSSIFTTSYGMAVGVIGSVFSVIISFAFMIFTAIYFNLDGHRLYNWFLRKTPSAYQPEIVTLLSRLRMVWERFFIGQLILIISMDVFIWLGGAALGLSEAFTLGIIAGLLEIVPVVGPVLAVVPAVIVALLQGSAYLPVNNFVFALIVIGYYVLANGIVNNFIYAIVLGEAVDLHPMIVFAGIMVGAAEWGILGALLAAPVIASIREITRYLYHKIMAQEPFPPNEIPRRSKWPSLPKLITNISTGIQSILTKLARIGRQSKI
jgi:predicted PurR-regulated permease PerM